MKKIFLIGVIFASSIGLSIAANEGGDEVAQICWHNSCGQIYCGAYYSSDPIEILLTDMATSEQDCFTPEGSTGDPEDED